MNTIGTTSQREQTVTKELTAKAVGSGIVEVFATPMMIALMEGAAADCVAPLLEEGYTTVGTQISISHSAATPVGMKVTAQAELTEVNGREYHFNVKAWDEAGIIGEGKHTRFAVAVERFEGKAKSRK